MNKLLFTILLVPFCAFSQNKLSSIYQLPEAFPTKMSKAKLFIQKTTSPYLIYNLIAGGNSAGQQNFQFKIQEKNPLQFELPFTDGIRIDCVDFKTKLPVNQNTFYVDYLFEYLKYKNDFTLTKQTFSPFSYFDLAVKYQDLSQKEVIAKIYLNLLAKVPENNRFQFILDEIQKKHPLPKTKAASALFGSDEADLSTEDKAERISEFLSEQLDTDLNAILYQCFIEKKADEQSFNNVKFLFDANIIAEIDELFKQKIIINFNRNAVLVLHEKFGTTLNGQKITIERVNCTLDFKEEKLLIDMVSNTPVDLQLKKSHLPSTKTIITNNTIRTDHFSIVISASGTQLLIEKKFTLEKYVVEIEKLKD
ncbi:MAG: hypothetical protein CFE24_00825 [Flavobacterium sp. BFFFF2]|nr:MAG: hypothetical protein CFE24_00825 [Flavobacterium sp. BFFFF2]